MENMKKLGIDERDIIFDKQADDVMKHAINQVVLTILTAFVQKERNKRTTSSAKLK